MTQPKIQMYATRWCPYCDRARQLLMKKRGGGLPFDFEEIDIEARPEARAEMVARSGRRTVPQIFIGDRHIGGSDDLYALDEAQGLDPLLQTLATGPEAVT